MQATGVFQQPGKRVHLEDGIAGIVGFDIIDARISVTAKKSATQGLVCVLIVGTACIEHPTKFVHGVLEPLVLVVIT